MHDVVFLLGMERERERDGGSGGGGGGRGGVVPDADVSAVTLVAIEQQ